jgi:hypothetical protein
LVVVFPQFFVATRGVCLYLAMWNHKHLMHGRVRGTGRERREGEICAIIRGGRSTLRTLARAMDLLTRRRAWFLIASILILSPSTSLIHIFFPFPPFTLSSSRCNFNTHSRCSSSPDAASFALRFAPHPTGCSLGHCATAGDGEKEKRARWSAGGGCNSCRGGPRWWSYCVCVRALVPVPVPIRSPCASGGWATSGASYYSR